MGKIIKNKDIVKILLCIFILLASIAVSKVYQSFAADQTAWPESTANKVYVRMSGPWGDGGLVITATTSWNKKKDGEKTKNNFGAKSRTISLSAASYNGNPYSAALVNGSATTSPDGGSGGLYTIITFQVDYNVPAHYWKSGFETKGEGGRFDCSTGIGHSMNQERVRVTYEVNLSRFGMVVAASDQKRHTDSTSVIKLGRSTKTIQWYNGYSGGWSNLRTVNCGDKLGNLPSVSRQYYDFDGWYDEHGDEVDANTIVCTDEDWFSRITARWTHKTAEITFYPQGGSGSMGVQTVNLGERTSLKANAFTRETYKFIGWTLDPDSRKVDYPDKQPITLTNEDGLELYAVWQKEDTGFDTQEVIEDAEMFGADGELKGGAGTVFDRNRTDSRFAHIDGGESDPAYFTKK